MREHLGEMKHTKFRNISRISDGTMIIDYVSKLIFEFVDYSITVDQIKDVTLTPDKNIVIEIALFDQNLYNAFVNDEQIRLLVEKGICYSPIDKCEETDYEVSYKNYRFKSASGSKANCGNWVYVLEKVD